MLQISPQVKLATWVLVFLATVLISSKFIQGPFDNSEVLGFASSFSFVFQSSELSKIVQENLSGKKGEYAVYIEDLSDGENYGLNQFDSFPSASLYKLYLIAAVLKEVELTMQTEITASKSHLTEVLGELDFGYAEAPEQITYTIEEALTRVGRISDNFASIMLVEKVGWDKIQDISDALGSTNTLIKSPIQTSAGDIGIFFKKLHHQEIVSAEVSDKIVEILSLNQINNRIPSGIAKALGQPLEDVLTDKIRIVHKTGELARLRHDAGIVYLPNLTSEVSPKAYIIVLMSKNLQYEDEGIETLANISKEVYEYFKNKK